MIPGAYSIPAALLLDPLRWSWPVEGSSEQALATLKICVWWYVRPTTQYSALLTQRGHIHQARTMPNA